MSALEDELYLASAGFETAITVFEPTTRDGLTDNGAWVQIVVLDHDGDRLAYRYCTDAQDEEWSLGTIEDAVDCAVENYEAAVRAEQRDLEIAKLQASDQDYD